MLFEEISRALKLLDARCEDSDKQVTDILKKAQGETEEIFMNEKQSSSNKGIYSEMFERLNLQSIGHFLQEGGIVNGIKEMSFTERDRSAERQLAKELTDLLGQTDRENLLMIITKYVTVREEIQFSLGMKAGSKIALLLASDSEYDY